MRHQLRIPLLSKPADQRKALLRGLTTQLIREGRVVVTLPSLISCVVKPLKSAFLWSAGLLSSGILSWCLIILKIVKRRFCFAE